MNSARIDQITSDAASVVRTFVFTHRAAAIPALLAACVDWAVEHGGADVVKGTLRNAIKLANDLDIERRRSAS